MAFPTKKTSSWKKPPSPNKEKTNERELRVGLKLHFKNQQITKRKPIQNEEENHIYNNDCQLNPKRKKKHAKKKKKKERKKIKSKHYGLVDPLEHEILSSAYVIRKL
jgi:hypothetical protein